MLFIWLFHRTSKPPATDAAGTGNVPWLSHVPVEVHGDAVCRPRTMRLYTVTLSLHSCFDSRTWYTATIRTLRTAGNGHRPPVHLCCCRPVLMGFFFARIVDPSPCCQPYLLRLFRPILRAYLASPVVRVHAKHPSQWHWQDIGNSQSRFSNRRHPFLETRLGGKQKRNANSARMLTTHIADYDVGHVLWQRVPESEKMTRNGPYLAGGAGSVCFLSSR